MTDPKFIILIFLLVALFTYFNYNKWKKKTYNRVNPTCFNMLKEVIILNYDVELSFKL